MLSAPLPPLTYIYTTSTHKSSKTSNSSRQKWTQTVESCSHKYNPLRLWDIIKSLNGKPAETPSNQPITFSSKSVTHNKEITAFAEQFTSPVSHTSDPSSGLSSGGSSRSFCFIIRYPTSPLILFPWLFKIVAILLSLQKPWPLWSATLVHLFNFLLNHCNIPAICKRAIRTLYSQTRWTSWFRN